MIVSINVININSLWFEHFIQFSYLENVINSKLTLENHARFFKIKCHLMSSFYFVKPHILFCDSLFS